MCNFVEFLLEIKISKIQYCELRLWNVIRSIFESVPYLRQSTYILTNISMMIHFYTSQCDILEQIKLILFLRSG